MVPKLVLRCLRLRKQSAYAKSCWAGSHRLCVGRVSYWQVANRSTGLPSLFRPTSFAQVASSCGTLRLYFSTASSQGPLLGPVDIFDLHEKPINRKSPMKTRGLTLKALTFTLLLTPFLVGCEADAQFAARWPNPSDDGGSTSDDGGKTCSGTVASFPGSSAQHCFVCPTGAQVAFDMSFYCYLPIADGGCNDGYQETTTADGGAWCFSYSDVTETW
jgi:hypothetical protein